MTVVKNKYQLGVCIEVENSQDPSKTFYEYQLISDKYRISGPTIICLSGNDCVDWETAASFACLAARLIKPDERVEMLSMAYSSIPNVRRASFTPEEAREVASQIFLPLVTDNGKRINVDLACKQLRQITILAYCFGNRVKASILDEFNAMLKDVGYSADETKLLLSQVYSVVYAPMETNIDDYGPNFFVKSFDDALFGGNYYEQKFGDETKPQMIGCGILERNNDNIELLTEKLTLLSALSSALDMDDHRIALINRTLDWMLRSDESSFNAEVTSQCLAYVLAYACANSINNANSQKHIPLDIDAIMADCQDIINSLSNTAEGQKMIEDNKKRIQKYIKEHTIVPFSQVLKELNLSEADIIAGNPPINKIINSYQGIIRFNSIYDQIDSKAAKYSLDLAKRRIVPKEQIMCLEILYDYGIIWSNAEVTNTKNNQQTFLSSLYRKLFIGKDTCNSIKFEVASVDGVKYLVLTDNYGCYPSGATKVKPLVDEWKQQYSNCSLTINPTEEQLLVIENLCTRFDIAKENVIYHTLQDIDAYGM